MTNRVSALPFLFLAAAIPGSAAVLFTSGAIDGNNNALFIDGPSGPATQTISNQFVATGSGTAHSLYFV